MPWTIQEVSGGQTEIKIGDPDVTVSGRHSLRHHVHGRRGFERLRRPRRALLERDRRRLARADRPGRRDRALARPDRAGGLLPGLGGLRARLRSIPRVRQHRDVRAVGTVPVRRHDRRRRDPRRRDRACPPADPAGTSDSVHRVPRDAGKGWGGGRARGARAGSGGVAAVEGRAGPPVPRLRRGPDDGRNRRRRAGAGRRRRHERSRRVRPAGEPPPGRARHPARRAGEHARRVRDHRRPGGPRPPEDPGAAEGGLVRKARLATDPSRGARGRSRRVRTEPPRRVVRRGIDGGALVAADDLRGAAPHRPGRADEGHREEGMVPREPREGPHAVVPDRARRDPRRDRGDLASGGRVAARPARVAAARDRPRRSGSPPAGCPPAPRREPPCSGARAGSAR